MDHQTNLSSPWLAQPAVVILLPVLLIVVSAIFRAIAKKEGMSWSDFYLGAEFVIAAMTASLIAACTLAHKMAKKQLPTSAQEFAVEMNLLAFTVVCLFIFAIIVAFHHSAEKEGKLDGPGPNWVFAGIFNVAGLTVFGGFLLLFWSV